MGAGKFLDWHRDGRTSLSVTEGRTEELNPGDYRVTSREIGIRAEYLPCCKRWCLGVNNLRSNNAEQNANA
jgi:hypothetical protein